MKIQLSGIAARELNKYEWEYLGILTRKELLQELYNQASGLKGMRLEISVNSKLLKDDDKEFTENDNVLVFNAFAGG